MIIFLQCYEAVTDRTSYHHKFRVTDDTQVAKVISDLVTMEALCEQLNEEIPGTKDWKHFAQSMDIDYESIDRALEPRGELKSPTQLMFEWLQCERPEFPADLVLTKLAEIKRYDVLQSIEKHFPGEFFLVKDLMYTYFAH